MRARGSSCGLPPAVEVGEAPVGIDSENQVADAVEDRIDEIPAFLEFSPDLGPIGQHDGDGETDRQARGKEHLQGDHFLARPAADE